MSFFYRHRVLLGTVSLFLVVLFSFGLCFFALNFTASQSGRLVVVLDAGHGGIDGGVVGVQSGMKESDINLLLSRTLGRKLEEAGISVVQTRLSEAGLYGTATDGYKKRDMKKRAEIIRDAMPVAVVSLHQNFFSLPSRRGGQVFYNGENERSKTLACLIQNSLNEMEECVRKSSPLAGDYFMVKCSDYPSVIVEGGFLSNAEDEALLISEEYREKLAEAIKEGILKFLLGQA